MGGCVCGADGCGGVYLGYVWGVGVCVCVYVGCGMRVGCVGVWVCVQSKFEAFNNSPALNKDILMTPRCAACTQYSISHKPA